MRTYTYDGAMAEIAKLTAEGGCQEKQIFPCEIKVVTSKLGEVVFQVRRGESRFMNLKEPAMAQLYFNLLVKDGFCSESYWSKVLPLNCQLTWWGQVSVANLYHDFRDADLMVDLGRGDQDPNNGSTRLAQLRAKGICAAGE